jgi:transglutaminase-like putative cysteine protease
MKQLAIAVTLLLPAVASAATSDVDPAVLAQMHKVKPADYPSANVVDLVADQAVVYQPDGQFSNTEHWISMVVTQAGKDEFAASTLDYAKDAETLDILVARVIKPDGTVIPVPDSAIKDTEQTGDANIYDPNGRAKKITFGGLAVGDAVELTYKRTRKTPTRVGFFNDVFAFQSARPMLESTYAVDAPAALPLTTQIYHPERAPKIAITKTTAGDRIHYAWAVHDTPQMISELAMDRDVEIPMLVVTTDPSWQHFSKWWADLNVDKIVATPELKAKVAELTKGAKTDADKIKALYDFVSSDIRYRGLGVGPRTGYTPRTAQETYTSRWGVCRDVAILLTTMLRADGFTAYPVITNMGAPVLPKIAYDGFNHAIVAMPKPGGGWTYLDPTAKNNNELLPGYEHEQSALVATPRGESLGMIPPADPATNLGHATATTVIAADGSMHSTVKLETKGLFDMLVRGIVAMMSADQQKHAIESVLHSALPDAVLASYEASPAIALMQPMTLTLVVDVPRAAVATGDYRLLRTLVTSGALGLVEAAMPMLVGGQVTRAYTLDAQVTFQYDEDETITLPAGTPIVALPNDAKAENAVSAVTATCAKKSATEIACHRSFQLRSRFVEPAQYLKLRELVAALGRVARQPIVLGGAK